MPEPTEYAQRVALAMTLREPPISKTALAEGAGVSFQAVSQLLTGSSKAFGVVAHARAARFLDVDAHWLATGEGEPKHPASLKPATQQPDFVVGTPEGTLVVEVKRPSLAAAATTIADYLLSADEMTREAVAPLLSRLATSPSEAGRVAQMLEMLVRESSTTAPPVAESAISQVKREDERPKQDEPRERTAEEKDAAARRLQAEIDASIGRRRGAAKNQSLKK